MKRRSAVSALSAVGEGKKARKGEDSPSLLASPMTSTAMSPMDNEDDSDDGGDYNNSEQENSFSEPFVESVQLSYCQAYPHDCLVDEGIYPLQVGETLVCSGMGYLRVYKGAIRILGATLYASPNLYRVSALGTHALPVVECVQVEDRSLLQEERTEAIYSLFEKYRAIVQFGPTIKEYASLGSIAQPFKNLSPGSNFQPLMTGPANTSIFSAFRSWYDCAYSMLGSPTPPVVLVAGPKSSGKSTFARFLTNFLKPYHIENTIHYLELDPGQPEFGIPGTVSLHRLSALDYNFECAYTSHQLGRKTLVKAHSLGDLSPKDQPDAYLSYAADLINIYKASQSQSPSPLVINTPGWARGLGLELTVDIARTSQPSHVVCLGPLEAQDNIFSAVTKFALEDPKSTTLIAPETVSPNGSNGSNGFTGPSRYSPPDLRALQILTYFHNDDFSRHMTEIAPYMVPFESNVEEGSGPAAPGAIKGVYIQQGEGIASHDIAMCINASIVAVVAVDKSIPIKITVRSGLPLIDNAAECLSPSNSHCIGHAVVQSIDASNHCFRLITPITPDTDHQLVLVRGRQQLPVWALWNSKLSDPAPYLSTASTSGLGAAALRVRRNIQRGKLTN